MKKVVKVILMGLLIDIGGSIAFQFVVGIIATVYLLKHGVGQAEVAPALIQLIMSQPWLSILEAIGAFISLLAGYYVTAKMKEKTYKYAKILGVCSSAIGFSMAYSYYPLSENIAMAVLTILSSVAGAWLWMKRNYT